MPPASTNSKGDTFTFRLDPALKAELTRAASEARIPPAQLVRALVRSHLADKEQQAFEAEARRQSLSIARRAGVAATDEAQVMAEIETDLESDLFSDTWKA